MFGRRRKGEQFGKTRFVSLAHGTVAIRDVPCARLRVSVAEVERKAGPFHERLQKRSSSLETRSTIYKQQPLRVRGIFRCHSRGDLSSLFGDRKAV